MAILEETEQSQGLALAIHKTKELKKQVLVSHTKKIECVDPLSFYQAGRERYSGERFFWQDPDQKLTIVGLGSVKKLQVDANSERYKEIERSWKRLQETVVKTGVEQIDGTGPLLFGGFSFDYKHNSSELWSQFGDNVFYIPSIMLSISKGQAYLTTNDLCSPTDQDELFLEMINEREQHVFQHITRDALASHLYVKQEEKNPEQWKQTVLDAVAEIKETNLDKIVLARELRVTFRNPIVIERVLHKLMQEQPNSYIFSLEVGSDCFIGATPEQLIKKNGNDVYSVCLAGSIKRGKNVEEDHRLGSVLLRDEKNVIEHAYVVSMITEAFESLCKQVTVPVQPDLMKTRHIQHLYTPVEGKCKETATIFDFIKKLHPTPALGGLPKEMAINRIRDIEGLERGLYAGPLGWVDTYGNGEFAVGIRSALVQENEASLFAGCGIVEDSEPEIEYKETAIKFNPMLSALGGDVYE